MLFFINFDVEASRRAEFTRTLWQLGDLEFVSPTACTLGTEHSQPELRTFLACSVNPEEDTFVIVEISAEADVDVYGGPHALGRSLEIRAWANGGRYPISDAPANDTTDLEWDLPDSPEGARDRQDSEEALLRDGAGPRRSGGRSAG